jgi:aminoglycoside 3-N-acetyltransferase
MRTRSTTQQRNFPQTKASILADLQRLGVNAGQLLMVHSSLSSIGFVLGGAQTVVRALVESVGPRGTLVLPSFSPEVSDPACWETDTFENNIFEFVRTHVPAFDPAITPTSMGAIAETFRNWPGVVRSTHPQVSICAHGPMAERIIFPHEIAWGQGAGSPFERLYDLKSMLLLIGVGFNRATLLHFAESRVPYGRRKMQQIPIDKDGVRSWLAVPDVGDDLNTHFPRIGEELLAAGDATVGEIGHAKSVLASSRVVVDFAQAFLSGALQSQ